MELYKKSSRSCHIALREYTKINCECIHSLRRPSAQSQLKGHGKAQTGQINKHHVHHTVSSAGHMVGKNKSVSCQKWLLHVRFFLDEERDAKGTEVTSWGKKKKESEMIRP